MTNSKPSRPRHDVALTAGQRAARDAAIRRLRAKGHTVRAIADTIGWSVGTVNNALKQADPPPIQLQIRDLADHE